MGCYNSVIVNCPKCGKEIDMQTKSGDCTLRNFTLENAPDQDMWDVNRHSPYTCYWCNTSGIYVEFDYCNNKAVNRRVLADWVSLKQKEENDNHETA